MVWERMRGQVHCVGNRYACGRSKRRQPVGEMQHLLYAPAALEPARPANDRRHANAALEDVVHGEPEPGTTCASVTRGIRSSGCPTENRVHARHQLRDAERLRRVVVRTEGGASHPVLHRVARGERERTGSRSDVVEVRARAAVERERRAAVAGDEERAVAAFELDRRSDLRWRVRKLDQAVARRRRRECHTAIGP